MQQAHEKYGHGIETPVEPRWSVGAIPVTWEPSEIKHLHKKTIRDNYKNGVINQATYKGMMQIFRKEYGGPNE